MQTKVIQINKENPSFENVDTEEIIKAIQKGDLVGCPTETVYGLCANALDDEAVKKIYVAKGRPSDNPLILHICDYDMLVSLVTNIPENAKKLVDSLWPGPLTIILNKKDFIPYSTTGGLDTVAIRMPNNNIMLNLIKTCGLPLAAPSANLSGKPSPTSANHVYEDLQGIIPYIIDGGDCDYGVESTIVDFTVTPPMVLRPGSITIPMLEKIIGEVDIDKSLIDFAFNTSTPKAPGMKYKHYSPLCKVTIVQGIPSNVTSKIINLAQSSNKTVGILCTNEKERFYDSLSNVKVFTLGSSTDLKTITKSLFKTLRLLDEYKIEIAYCEGFSYDDEGLAIMNRLIKASGHNIIEV
ncbi:MAG: L-threonylcarbamoyladenylate synthase [Lachnospirales bacterium]